MNTIRILTTIFGMGACAALASGGAQANALPAGSPTAIASVIGLWLSAGVLGFVYVRAASSGAWLAYAWFVVLYVGVVLIAVQADSAVLLAFGPAVLELMCVLACVAAANHTSPAWPSAGATSTTLGAPVRAEKRSVTPSNALRIVQRRTSGR